MVLWDSPATRFDALYGAILIFVELRYVELGPNESILDPKFEDDRNNAITSVRNYLEDEDDEALEVEVRRGIVYLLNVDRKTFEQHLRALDFPLPRWEPDAAHAILRQIWRAIWADWRVPDFDELEFDVITTADLLSGTEANSVDCYPTTVP